MIYCFYNRPFLCRTLTGLIESRGMRWDMYVSRIGEVRNAYNILVGKPKGK